MDNADMLLTCDKMLWAISVNNICRFFFFSLTKVSHKSPVSSNAVYLCTYSVKYHINILRSYNSKMLANFLHFSDGSKLVCFTLSMKRYISVLWC